MLLKIANALQRLLLRHMPDSFSRQIIYNKQTLLAVIVPQLRRNGMHYEVNIKGFPRFYMVWGPLGRYDVAGSEKLPYELVLAVSDVIEKQVGCPR